MRIALFLPGLLLCVPSRAWDADFHNLCEHVRNQSIAVDPSLANRTTFVCGQEYAKNTEPADYITTTLDQCLLLNSGWEKSRIDQPSQWAGPLVGFLVPSLGFIISIPREWNIPAPSGGIGKGVFISMVWAVINLFSLVFDTLIGIAVVFGWAGPYIAGALHETFVDWAILQKIRRIMRVESGEPPRRPTESEWFALAITLVGAFDVNTRSNPNLQRFADIVKAEIERPYSAYIFLKQSCVQLVPFGIQVGVPLVFYVAASIYSLIDAQARLGDNDTAHSIAFGLWYYTIVLVAIMSSMVLSAGAGRIIEAVMARHNLTDKDHKLKWLCERRWVLYQWSRETIHNGNAAMVRLDPQYSDIFDQHFGLRSAVLAVLILFMPWAFAFTVSYTTPEIGVSCRSATVLAYAISQVLLIVLWFFHSSPGVRNARIAAKGRNKAKYYALWAITGMYYLVGVVALCITIAGTIMQLVGVYRNCVCKAGLWDGFPTTPLSARTTAVVKLSTDTQADRDQAYHWMVLGGSGVGWLVILCALAGWHRVRMRQRCLELIDELYDRA